MRTLFRLKPLASCLLVTSLIMVAVPRHADANTAVRNEMYKMFNSMTNVTSPGVFETSRRGVIAGGSINVRNRIMNTNIVSMQPPSFNAGCGGLDFFGGSFSFINKEQFVALARSIASNAAGYAFYLALGAMSDDVRGVIDDLQKKMQQINQFLGNSCQLAQGIVNDTFGSMNKQRQTDASLKASFDESFGDFFETSTGSTGTAPDQAVTDKDSIRGNLIWKALKKKGAASWFTYGGDDLLMAIMTISGTIIVGEDQNAPDGKGQSPEIIERMGNEKIKLKDLIEGGTVEVYRCDDTSANKCLNLTESNSNIKGFESIVNEMLLGSSAVPGGGSSVGIMTKIAQNVNLSAAEQNFIGSLPNGMGGMLFRVARLGDDLVRNFVTSISKRLALEMAMDMMIAFNDAAGQSLASLEDQAFVTQAKDVLDRSRIQLNHDYQAYSSNVKPISDIMTEYNTILTAAGAKGLVTPSMPSPVNSTPSS